MGRSSVFGFVCVGIRAVIADINGVARGPRVIGPVAFFVFVFRAVNVISTVRSVPGHRTGAAAGRARRRSNVAVRAGSVEGRGFAVRIGVIVGMRARSAGRAVGVRVGIGKGRGREVIRSVVSVRAVNIV